MLLFSCTYGLRFLPAEAGYFSTLLSVANNQTSEFGEICLFILVKFTLDIWMHGNIG